MVSKLDIENGTSQISREALEWLLRRIIQLPKNWLITSSIFILISTIQINWGKEPSVKFQVTNTTAIFMSLVWLPSILKILALSGGAVKTPVGEIGSSGMMTILQSLTADSLGFLIEQTKLAEDVAPPQQQLEMREIRHEWQKVYASRVPASEVREQMERLAQYYKQLRLSMQYGPKRTFEMESIAGRMRALAPQVNFSAQEVKDLLQSNDQGKRLLGLSIAERSRDLVYFNPVLHLIDYSETAFEQTCALRAVQKMIPKLNNIQKKDLQVVLNNQRNYNPDENRWIKPDSNRWIISDRLLSMLQT